MKLRHFINIFWVLLLVSCGQEPQPEPKPQELELKKTEYSILPGWQQDNHAEAYKAFLLSCQKVKFAKGEFLGASQIKINRIRFVQLCEQAQTISPDKFKSFVEDNFDPYLVLYQGSSEGKFTAYYEPLIRVSKTPDDKYKYPIHAKPLDLIEFNPHDFDASMPSKRLVGRIKEQKLVPYYSRAEIAGGQGNIPVLLWADSFVDVFVMHIQGPALAEFEDKSQIRISYADTNGLKFKGIGSILLQNKELKAGEASMGQIKKWLLANPDKALQYMNQNPRYVFHQLIGATGPLGALNTPLVAGRSLAVDTQYIPLGALLWLDTVKPDGTPLQRLINAQDVGGAIKGAIRGDFFWGSGGDDVLQQAGQMNSKGSYYIMLPKQEKNNGKKD